MGRWLTSRRKFTDRSKKAKKNLLEIIEKLEPTRRGLYGGCIGYFDFNGNLDTAIAIRTALIRDGIAYVQAGAGIVADSDPDSEHEETVNKAAAMAKAIDLAEKAFVSR